MTSLCQPITRHGASLSGNSEAGAHLCPFPQSYPEGGLTTWQSRSCQAAPEELIIAIMSTFSFVRQLDREQVIILVIFAVAQFSNAVCVSLLAPFYPGKAASKGATATEYGLVFGIYELTVFLVSPLLGKKVACLGAKNVFCSGILVVSVCGMGFGLLDNIEGRVGFVGASLGMRVVEAVGCACFKTACFSLIAQVFPGGIATVFSMQEIFFGVGLITGPMVGGILYQASGYDFMAPFLTLGSCLAAVAVASFCFLPASTNDGGKGSGMEDEEEKKTRLRQLIRVAWVPVGVASIVSVSAGIGFITVGLEIHLQRFDFSPVGVGLMFGATAVSYAASSPLFGSLCDRGHSPLLINCIGLAIFHVSYLLMGPVWDCDAADMNDPRIWIQVLSLVLNGVGTGAVFVSTYSLFHRQATHHGFDDTLETSGLISGLWTSAFSLGAFLGPLAGGALIDRLGFPLAAVALPGSLTVTVLAAALVYAGLLSVRRAGYDEWPELGHNRQGKGEKGQSKSHVYPHDRSNNKTH